MPIDIARTDDGDLHHARHQRPTRRGHRPEEQRQLYENKTTQPDWSALLEEDTLTGMATAAASLLDAETFRPAVSRDALGRVRRRCLRVLSQLRAKPVVVNRFQEGLTAGRRRRLERAAFTSLPRDAFPIWRRPMTHQTLLHEFIREECNIHVRALLKAALGSSAPPVTEIGLNRFDVRIDRDRELVVIEDITNAGEEGSLEVRLVALLEALEHERVAQS
ncbi:hypothetical protein ACNOYE_21120 [Nannocystaceae bacterium ST9]